VDTHASVVAPFAFGGRGLGSEVASPEGLGSLGDLGFHLFDEIVIHGARLALAVVQLVHLDQVGILTGEFLVAERIDVELSLGDVFGLGAFGGLEVHDCGLAGVFASDEVYAANHADAVVQRDLDLFFGKLDVLKLGLVVGDVVANDFAGGFLELLLESGVGVGRVEVAAGQVCGVSGGGVVSI